VSGPGDFPARSARTRGFSLGRPRSFTVAPDGARVAFLRSAAADDPVTALWVVDLDSGSERLVADPGRLLAPGGEVPAAELARRERARERAGGIVAYATDAAVTLAAFALAGRLFVADLAGAGGVRELAAAGPVVDPRPDPGGRLVAYVREGALRVVEVAPHQHPGGADRELAADPDPDVTWGLAEFVAAEEMGRARGFWWSPDGTRLAVARVDNRPVGRWYVADPTDPAAAPAVLRYPAAGTANAEVGLHLLGLDGDRVEVAWDRAALPYLAAVSWPAGAPLTLTGQSRDQRTVEVLAADPATGATRTLWRDSDPVWVELVPGSPAWLPGGRLVTVADRGPASRLLVDGEPVTGDGLQVRSVVACGPDGVIVRASEDPTEVHLWRVGAGGRAERLTAGQAVHDGVAAGATLVVSSSPLRGRSSTTVRRSGRPDVPIAWPSDPVQASGLDPAPALLTLGKRELRAALLLPSDPAMRSGELGRLPVLLDPYGGPHAQRVLASGAAYLTSQWLADQGFAVLVADGRGTPGRGPDWARAVAGDLAEPVLEDQVAALEAAAAEHPQLDLGRVGIRGWSFGGYLAALAVLRRPDVFHAAVAGAPVTEWRLYDTHYTERYLGDPASDPDAYERSSLLADAARLRRPLLLVHGLADDNVVAAHTLRLSGALLAAGRAHAVLPLARVTHMTPQVVVAENLLRLQLDFLRTALGAG
jgi:dipeptidyl-peptidase-4